VTKEEIHARISLARQHLARFTKLTFPAYDLTRSHQLFAGVLNAFAQGKIRKLIISQPPQHGKSELSSRRLPAFLLGKYPDSQIAIAAYSQSFARKFGREVRRIMADDKYRHIFPASRLAEPIDKGYTNSADIAEIVGHRGSLILAGRGSGLTGMPVDWLLMDDLYKNSEEANSPIVRASVIEWYKTVAETRLHNDSHQLIVFTRWHQEDLVGWLESQGLVDELTDRAQLEDADSSRWLKLNFPAIKEGPAIDLDPREPGEALWPDRHSAARLLEKKTQDTEVFDSLYQGNPKPSKGLLYEGGFLEYDNLPDVISSRWGYVDTADEGKDYLCAICAVFGEGKIYIVDILYTQDGQEITEPLSADLFKRNLVDTAHVESNAGGRAFARAVQRQLEADRSQVKVRWFTQTKNKEARIITNSSQARQSVLFPRGWRTRWPEFSRHILEFRKVFRSNSHDDAADALTGIIETSPLVHSFGFVL